MTSEVCIVADAPETAIEAYMTESVIPNDMLESVESELSINEEVAVVHNVS